MRIEGSFQISIFLTALCGFLQAGHIHLDSPSSSSSFVKASTHSSRVGGNCPLRLNGTGTERYMKQSNLIDTCLHFRHLRVERSWPWNKSTIRLRCVTKWSRHASLARNSYSSSESAFWSQGSTRCSVD